MADGKIKISDLDEALQLSDNAEFPYTQDNGGVPTTFKAPANQIARKVAEGSTFTNLTTTAKTLVGAINELKALGSPILLGTTSPTAQQGANGNLYVQYTEGTGGADDEVDAIFVKIDSAWCEISTGGGGGSGGHTIVDDSGTSLTQRTNLQFKGAYSKDNATDDTTEIDVVREMTKAEFDELTEAEKTGLINITDLTGGNDDRFQPVIYSEDEREIGVWTNGKPLYQKTGHLAENLSIGNSWTNFVLSDPISNVETIAQVIYNSGAPFGFGDGFVMFRANSGNLQAQLKGSSTSITFNTAWVVTFVYTKTTDTAGSGTWTPQGVPAVHYSETEQVVGTWVDGSTLYEKTVHISSLPNATTTEYETGLSNITPIGFDNILIFQSGNTSKAPYLNTNSTVWIAIQFNANGKIYFGANTDQRSTSAYVTLRYTKAST